jgi:streptogramin lyase
MSNMFMVLTLLCQLCFFETTRAQNVSFFAAVGESPLGLAFDRDRNLFVANYGSQSISKITFSAPAQIESINNTYINIAAGLPRHIAFDSQNNMFVSVLFSKSRGAVQKFDASGLLLDSNFGNVTSWIDGIIVVNNTVYFYDVTQGLIRTMSATDGVLSATPFASGLSGTTSNGEGAGGLAFDTYGNLIVTNFFNNSLQIAPGNNSALLPYADLVSNTIVTFPGPSDVVVNCVGTVFSASVHNGFVTRVRMNSTGAQVNYYGAVMDGPFALAIDSVGNIFVTSYYSNVTSIITPSSGVCECVREERMTVFVSKMKPSEHAPAILLVHRRHVCCVRFERVLTCLGGTVDDGRYNKFVDIDSRAAHISS